MPKPAPRDRKELERILQIPATAKDDDIHRSYRKLASTLHPDMGGDKETFLELQDAYEQMLNLLSRESQPKPVSNPATPTAPQKTRPIKSPQGTRTPPHTATHRASSAQHPTTHPATGANWSAHRPVLPGQQPLPHQQEGAPVQPRGNAMDAGFMTRKLPLQDATTTFILVNVLDIFMTYLLLHFGAIEANPLANYVFQLWNFKGMIAFKLIIVALVCVIAQVVAVSSIRKASYLLGFGTVLVGAVVAYSAILILPKVF